MNVNLLLRKKRDGEEITKDEIGFFVSGLVNGEVAESQIGAFLTSVYIRGLTETETVDLTRAMSLSGEPLQWDNPAWEGLLVDKHSTGGVGDKISLILVPVMAACGLKMPMITGRSLEYTGGTLDKLEAIPGFIVDLDAKRMKEGLEHAGCFMSAATTRLCPADRILYRVRDITSTVDSLPLIVSSIISKKIASGIKYLVIDVKVGKAAFCKTLESGRKLAKQLISVSKKLGVSTRVVLTRMDQPLGQAVGNSLEVAEVVQSLLGNIPSDIRRVVSILGSILLDMTQYKGNAESQICKVIEDGSAMKCFSKMLEMQGVDSELASQLTAGAPVLPTAKYTIDIKCPRSGWVADIDALALGLHCQQLGATRLTACQDVDRYVGVLISKHQGDAVAEGDIWLTVHYNEPLSPEVELALCSAITIVDSVIVKPDVFIEVIT